MPIFILSGLHFGTSKQHEDQSEHSQERMNSLAITKMSSVSSLTILTTNQVRSVRKPQS